MPDRPSVLPPLIALALVAALAWAIARKVRASRPAPPPTRSRLLPLGAALGAAVAVEQVLLAVGRVWSAHFLRGLWAATASAAATVGVSVLGLSLAAALLARTPPRRARAYVAAVFAVYFGGGYAAALRQDHDHRFGALYTFAAHTRFQDQYPNRPSLFYATNALGFREPEIAEPKPAGSTRIAVIGDSYVFGIGVDRDETLPVQLARELRRRHPERAFDVVNLGIPGDNLSSHVDLYAEAAARLAPDVVVVCLTLPNDLSRWDVQSEHREAHQVGIFSLVGFLFGHHPAATTWQAALLEMSVTPEGLAHLDHEAARLEALRAAAPGPGLVFFPYQTGDEAMLGRLRRIPGAAVMPAMDFRPTDAIPGDGHPTAAGNGRYAAAIAAFLER